MMRPLRGDEGGVGATSRPPEGPVPEPKPPLWRNGDGVHRVLEAPRWDAPIRAASWFDNIITMDRRKQDAPATSESGDSPWHRDEERGNVKFAGIHICGPDLGRQLRTGVVRPVLVSSSG